MILKLGGTEIARKFEPRLFGGERCRMQLPENWYNDFSGFLFCATLVSNSILRPIISMKYAEKSVDGSSMGMGEDEETVDDDDDDDDDEEEEEEEEEEEDVDEDEDDDEEETVVDDEEEEEEEKEDEDEDVDEEDDDDDDEEEETVVDDDDDDEEEDEDDDAALVTCVLYFPFSVFRHTAWWDPTSTAVEMEFHDKLATIDKCGMKLVPKGAASENSSSGGQKETTPITHSFSSSSSSDDDYKCKLRILHDSKSAFNFKLYETLL